MFVHSNGLINNNNKLSGQPWLMRDAVLLAVLSCCYDDVIILVNFIIIIII